MGAEPLVVPRVQPSVEADTPRTTSSGGGSSAKNPHATPPLPSSPDVLATAQGFASPPFVSSSKQSSSNHQ